jgi:hypothetical protein
MQLLEICTNLSSFCPNPNNTISDTQFANLLHSHATTPSYSSAIIWSCLFNLLVTSLIAFCIFFMSYQCHRRHLSLRFANVPMFDLAINVVQPPLLAYQPQSLDYKDLSKAKLYFFFPCR